MISSMQTAREQLRAEREAHRLAEDRRIAALCQRVPEAAVLSEHLEQLMMEAPKLALSPGTDVQATLAQLRTQRAELEAQLTQALAHAGLPADALVPQPLCPTCEDAGFIGFPQQRDCVCVRHRAAELLTRWSGLGPDAGAFEHCDLSVFSDASDGKASPRARMRRIFADAEAYADAFPNVAKPNVFMTGESGLGKTFVAQCVTRRVAARGIPAVMMHAGELSNVLRAHHLDLAGRADVETLLEVPLLVLDDLGSEPMYENITIPHLFTLLNQRKLQGRATIIITNLMPPEFGARYTERVLSRALDTRNTELLLFTGSDVRL